MFPNRSGKERPWLSKKMIAPLVGDFFETLTREVAQAKIIANNNGETARFGSADLVGLDKLIIEVKASAESRSDYTFGASQLKDYYMFHQAGYRMFYYLWEYEKPRGERLSKYRTEESLFEYLADATRRLTILSHEEVWPMFPADQIADIWFDERDCVALRKRILRPAVVLKERRQLKVNGFILDYELYGDIHRRQYRQESRPNRRMGIPACAA